MSIADADPAAAGSAAVFAEFCEAGLWPGLGRALAGRLAEAGITGPEHMTAARLQTLDGIGPKRALRLAAAFEDVLPAYDAAELLVSCRVPARYAGPAVGYFGNAAAERLREDPWLLLSLPQIQPDQADWFARKLLGAQAHPQDPRRGRAIVAYLLTRAARDGHTAVPADVIMRAAGRFRIDDPAAAVAAAVEHGTVLPFEEDDFPGDDADAGDAPADGDGESQAARQPDGAAAEADAAGGGAGLLALARYALAEDAIAEGLARLAATAAPLDDPAGLANGSAGGRADGPDDPAGLANGSAGGRADSPDDPAGVANAPAGPGPGHGPGGSGDRRAARVAGGRPGRDGPGDPDGERGDAIDDPTGDGGRRDGPGDPDGERGDAIDDLTGDGGRGDGPGDPDGGRGDAIDDGGRGDGRGDGPRDGGGVIELDEAQRRAVAVVASHGVSVLAGGPGTGKSRTVEAVVALAAERGLRVALAAPTGRAAKRLEELTGAPATTLHRLLGAQGRSRGESGDGGAASEQAWVFSRGEDWPVDADLIVVDESSMLDAELAAALVEACEDGTRLLFVGDPAQLPSIGPGRVLADIIDSGAVPVTELTTLYRQREGGVIARLATAVRGGELPPVASGPGSAEHEAVVVPVRGSEQAALRVTQLVTDSIPRVLGIRPAEIQVVTPVHKGAAGTVELNKALKARLNPGPGAHSGFDPGDRVVAIANHIDDGFANGEVGTVDAAADDGLVITFAGLPVIVPFRLLSDLRHGWAMTVHRAQGSEWPAVVAVFPAEASRMLSRPLVYTALTRAQRHLSVVHGAGPALARAVRVIGERPRQTRLAALLMQ